MSTEPSTKQIYNEKKVFIYTKNFIFYSAELCSCRTGFWAEAKQ
jgi:hypothetical protein